MKIYVILEIGWEYNDEYYYRPESGGGKPIEAYFDETLANERCVKKNADAAKTHDSKWYRDENNRAIKKFFEVVPVIGPEE